MNTTTTLKDALLAWEKHQLQNFNNLAHINEVQLSAILQGRTKASYNEIEHIVLCPECLPKLDTYQRLEESTEFWETAWRKAAATSEIQWPQKLSSHDGTYLIVIRQSESNRDQGLIIVTVNEKQREKLEGSKLTVIDGKGRTLLTGTVKKGEAFQRIDNLNTIDLRLMVRTLD